MVECTSFLLLLYLCGWLSSDGGADFNKGCNYLEATREEERSTFSYGGNYVKEIAWAFERPQFWFEHMVLSHYENNMWQEHFRISRQTFRFVCDLVRPHLGRQDTNMRRAIPVEKGVAVALWRLATGNSYWSTGLVFGVKRCTALNLKDEFCSALLMSAKDFIKFSKGEAETRRALQAFQEISFFPQVVGAIDGSHIPIITPKNDPNDYYNRK